MGIEVHSDATIASAALVRVGEKTIESLDDLNDRARTARALYFQAKQYLLSIHPWQFNLFQGFSLTRLTAVPTTRWTFEYTLPPDRESDDLRAVYSEAAIGARPMLAGFAIQNGRLYSDETALWCDYSRDISEGAWPPYFSEVMITMLAMQFANPITDQQNTADSFREALMGTASRPGVLQIAMNVDARPGEVRTVDDAPFVRSRFAGSGSWLG